MPVLGVWLASISACAVTDGDVAPSVAVLDFDVAEEKRTQWDWAARGVADLLEIELAARDIVTVDRDLIRALFQEQKAAIGGIVDADTLTTAGLTAAELAVAGQITPLDDSTILLNARLLRTATGEVMATVSVQGPWKVDLQKRIGDLADRLLASANLRPSSGHDVQRPESNVRPEALMMFYEGVNALARGQAGTAIAFFIDAYRQDGGLNAARAWEIKAYRMAGPNEDADVVMQLHAKRLQSVSSALSSNRGERPCLSVLPPVLRTAASPGTTPDVSTSKTLKLELEQHLLASGDVRVLDPSGLRAAMGEADLHITDLFEEHGMSRYGRWFLADGLLLCKSLTAEHGQALLECTIMDPLSGRQLARCTESVSSRELNDGLQRVADGAVKLWLTGTRGGGAGDVLSPVYAADDPNAEWTTRLPVNYTRFASIVNAWGRGKEPSSREHRDLAEFYADHRRLEHTRLQLERSSDAIRFDTEDEAYEAYETILYLQASLPPGTWVNRRWMKDTWEAARRQMDAGDIARVQERMFAQAGAQLPTGCVMYVLAHQAWSRKEWEAAATLGQRAFESVDRYCRQHLKPRAKGYYGAEDWLLAGALFLRSAGLVQLGRLEEARASLDKAEAIAEVYPGKTLAFLKRPRMDRREGVLRASGGTCDGRDLRELIAATRRAALGTGDNARAGTETERVNAIRTRAQDWHTTDEWLSIVKAIEETWASSTDVNAAANPPLREEALLALKNLAPRIGKDRVRATVDVLAERYLTLCGLCAPAVATTLPPETLVARISDVSQFYEAAGGSVLLSSSGWRRTMPFFEDPYGAELGVQLLKTLPCAATPYRRMLEKVQERLPDMDARLSASLWSRLASQEYTEGRSAVALEAYAAALRSDPKVNKGCLDRVLIDVALREQSSDHKERVRELCARLRMLPWEPDERHWFEAGREYQASRAYAKAVTCYDVVIDLISVDPKLADPSRSSYTEGEMGNRRRYLRDPSDRGCVWLSSLYWKAQCLFALGQQKEGVAAICREISLTAGMAATHTLRTGWDPGRGGWHGYPNTSMGYRAKQLATENARTPEETRAANLKRWEWKSSQGEVGSQNSLAWHYAERGENLDEALELSRKAVAQNPEKGAYLDTLGWILWQQDRKDEAVPLLIEGHERDPNDPVHTYHAALAYAERGNIARAEELLTMALAVAKKEDLTAAIRRELDSLTEVDGTPAVTKGQ